MKKCVLILLCTLMSFAGTCVMPAGITQADLDARQGIVKSIRDRVFMQTLTNGVTVVCFYAPNTNQVMVGGLVGVGCRHEQVNEWGIAHILEHMSCKATKNFPEGSIDHLAKTHGLSRSDYNAHTWYDHTYYYFNTDAANWQVFGDVVADIVQNVVIDPSALTSELGAVSQEIKYRSQDQSALDFIDFLPFNHPYTHTPIGYKEEVLTYTAEQVTAFYNKYYTPDRTTFFVFGNVDPSLVFKYAEKTFAGFNRPNTIEKPHQATLPFYAGFSTVTKTVYHSQLTRQYQSLWMGAPQNTSDAAALEYVAYAVSRRLKQKFVDQEGWCTSATCQTIAFDYAGYFVINLMPKEGFFDINYDAIIAAEIADITANGVRDDEFVGMYQESLESLVSAAEDPSQLVLTLALTSLVHNDVFTQYCIHDEYLQQVSQDSIKQVAAQYLRHILMGKEIKLPLPEEERGAWQKLQSAVSAHDAALLASRTRAEEVPTIDFSVFSDPVQLSARPSLGFSSFVLSNGMTVYFKQEAVSPRCVFSLMIHNNEAACFSLGADGKAFAKSIWHKLLLYGTDKYTKKEFDELCDSLGVSFISSESCFGVSALNYRFEKALELMRLALDKPQLPEEILTRKKLEAAEIMAQKQNDLSYQLSQYLTRTLYKDRPWKFAEAEQLAHLNAINMDDIRAMISLVRDPSKAIGVMSGDFDEKEAKVLAERYFGTLNEKTTVTINPVLIPDITATVSGHVDVANERSYVLGIRPTCTIDSTDAAALDVLSDYLYLLLWKVRERTGLFYASGSAIQPGSCVLPGTLQIIIVAVPGTVDRLKREIQNIVDSLYQNGIDESTVQSLKRERLHNRGKYLFTPYSVLNAAAEAIDINMPLDYQKQFDEHIMQVTVEQVNAVIKKYFDPSTWSFITLGNRVD